MAWSLSIQSHVVVLDPNYDPRKQRALTRALDQTGIDTRSYAMTSNGESLQGMSEMPPSLTQASNEWQSIAK